MLKKNCFQTNKDAIDAIYKTTKVKSSIVRAALFYMLVSWRTVSIANKLSKLLLSAAPR